MGRENGKTGRCKSRASQLARFLHREGRKYCAVALCASLIAGSIGNMAIAADESTSNEHEFELSRVALYEALQEAVLEGNTLEKSFTFTGEAADTYDSLLDADGNLYELTPEIEDNDGALQLRIFARLDGEIELESAYDIDGSEEMIFLLTNSSDVEKRAVIHVDDKVTEEIKVAPKSAVLPGDLVNPYKSAAEAAGGPGAAANGETAAADAGEAIVINGGGVSSGGGSGSGGGGGSSSGGNGGSDVVVLDPTDGGKETETQENQDAAESNDAADETGASDVPEETENNEKADGTVQEDPNDKVEDGKDKDSDAGKEDQKEDDAVDTGKSDADVSIDTGNGNDTNQGSEDVAEDSEVSVDEPEQAKAEDQNDADSADSENADGNDGDTAGENLSAAISYHKTYLVTATPSDAEDEEEEATPSDATDSDAEKNQLDGMVYDAVCADGDAVVAFVTTAEDLGLDVDPDEFATPSDAIRVYEAEVGKIFVQVTADKDAFSKEVELFVTELGKDDDQYQVVQSALDKEGTEYDGMMALDIRFEDSDGIEVEPEEGSNVQVSFQMKTDTFDDDVNSDSLMVHHIMNKGDGVKAEPVADVEDATEGTVELQKTENEPVIAAEFVVESFSVFTITWSKNNDTRYFDIILNCVDENGKEIPGANSSIELSPILDNEGTVTKVFGVDYKKTINGYEYLEAKYNNDSVTKLSATVKSSWRGTTRKIELLNANNESVYSVTATSSVTKINIDFIYKKSDNIVKIKDTILTNGLYSAVVSGNTQPKIYKWFSSTDGDTWTAVVRRKITGDFYNQPEDLSAVNVALDGGAQKYYKVEAYDENGNLIGSSAAYLVDYFDKLENGSFENPNIENYTHNESSHQWQFANGTLDLIWKTTGTGPRGKENHDIEILRAASKTEKQNAGKYHNCEAAAEGVQFAELNCEAFGALYQDVLTIPGTTLHWKLSHRGRNGEDTMRVVIMSSESAADIKTQEDVSKIDKKYYQIPDGKTDSNIKDGIGKWESYKGDYDVPEGQYLTRFFFVAVETATGDETVGNLLDDVYFTTELPPPSEDKGSISITKSVEGLDDLTNYEVTLDVKGCFETEGKEETRSLKLNHFVWDSKTSTYSASGAFSDIRAGKYIVTEKCSAITGYDGPKVEVKVGDSVITSANNEDYVIWVEDGKITNVHVVNKYEKQKSNLTVKKVVAGNMANPSKYFSFSITVNGKLLDTGEQTYDITKTVDGIISTRKVTIKDGGFELSHEESIILNDLDAGTSVVISEIDNGEGYITTNTTNNNDSGGRECTISSLVSGDTTVVFTNTKQVDPPTGIFTHRIPYMLMFALAVLGMTGFTLTDFKRRAHRRRNQD